MKEIPKDTPPKEITTESLKEIAYFAWLQGATLWQYAKDNNCNLPEDFEKAILGIRDQIKDQDTLAYLLGSTPVVMGLFGEIVGFNERISTIASINAKKTETKKPHLRKKSNNKD